MRTPRLSALTLLAVLATAPACQTQWFQVTANEDTVTTTVRVRSNPTGAKILRNETDIGPAPLDMPVRYPHKTSLWERQTNLGATLRDSWGTVGTIIGFPIWLPASLIHLKEEKYRHEYGSNRFVLSALLPGYDEGWREVDLNGEDEIDVVFDLTPSK